MNTSENSASASEPDETDAGLIRRIAGRDRAAFVVFFERYARRVKLFLIRRGLDEGDADELSQEVMVQVWRRAETYDPAKASASTWVFTIARNRRIDLMRKFARPEPDPNDPLFQPDPEPPAVETLAAEQREAAMRTALKALNPDQLAVINAAFFDGLSQSEIAAQLDIPLGTVKSRLRLAFGALRKELGEDAISDLLA